MTQSTTTTTALPALDFTLGASGIDAANLAKVAAFLSAQTGGKVTSLPAIEGVAGPAGVATLAGNNPPLAEGLTNAKAPPAGAPQIAEWTRSGGAGDTVVLSGANLAAGLQVFVFAQQSNGQAMLAEASVTMAQGNTALVTLPPGLPANDVYAFWATNASGASTGELVNSPEVWWVGADDAAPGQTISLYGRDLAIPGSTPTVVLRMTDGAAAGKTFAIAATASTGYRVDAALPANLPAGHFQVYFSDTVGGIVSWSDTQAPTLTVRTALAHNWTGPTTAKLDLSAYGARANDGADDSAAFAKAIAAARGLITSGAAQDVTIQLDAGTYDIAQSITLEDGIALKGAGAGSTTIAASGTFATLANPALIVTGASLAAATAEGASVADLTLDTRGDANATAVFARGSNHVTLQSTTLIARGTNDTPFDAHASQYFTIEGSTVVGQASFIGSAHQISIHDNAFYGSNQAGENIIGFGASAVALYNNTAQNLNADPNSATWQADTYQGRFYVDQTHDGQPVNQYIAGNTTSGLGAFVEHADQVDTNTGEQVLFEGAGETTQLALAGRIKASTTTSLTLTQALSTADPIGTGALLTVASGSDAGATTEITSYDPATHTLHFASPLTAALDKTSTIIISRAPNQIAVVDNTLDGRAQDVASSVDTASVGVEVYPGGARVAIDGNTFKDLRQAVALWSFPATKDDPKLGGDNALVGTNFFDIKNNTVQNSLVGVAFHQDPGGAADLGQPASVVNADQAIGTTIQHNDLSGTLGSSLSFETRQPTAVTIATANVASNNTLSSNGILGGLGFQSGASGLIVEGAQTGTTLASRLATAKALHFTTTPRYFGTAALPAFEGSVASDGSLALQQESAVAGTLNGVAALIATGTGGNDIGFTADSTDPRLEVLHGGNGDDVLVGGPSTNELFGDAGNDILVAGVGTTAMTGGTGADVFLLSPATIAPKATIADFSEPEGDRIVIDAVVPAGVDPVAAGYLRLQADGAATALLYSVAGGGKGLVKLADVMGTVSASDITIGIAAASALLVPASTTSSPPTSGATAPAAGSSGAAVSAPASSTVASTTAGANNTPSHDVLTLVLAEDAYQGDAQFTVSVDGHQLGGVETVTASHRAGQSETFQLTGAFGAGAHTVGITFLNDAFGGTRTTDRNLYVDALGIDGTTTTENALQAKNGSQSYKVQAPANASNATQLSVAAGATLIIDKATAATTSLVAYAGQSATVQFTDASAFHGQIAGFAKSDALDLPALHFAGQGASAQYDSVANLTTLSVKEGTAEQTLQFQGNVSSQSFAIAADTTGGTLVTRTS